MSDVDSVGFYLASIGKIPLFSRENHEEEKMGKALSAARAHVLDSVEAFIPKITEEYTRTQLLMRERISIGLNSKYHRREQVQNVKTVHEFIADFISAYGIWPDKNELQRFNITDQEQKIISLLRLSDLREEVMLWQSLEKGAAKKVSCRLPPPIFSLILKESSREKGLKYWNVRIFHALAEISKLPESIAGPLRTMIEIENRFIEANLRWVAKIAKGYLYRCEGKIPRVDYNDVVQAGNIGLFWAVRRFDPATGFRFSTFSTSWIMLSIRQVFENTNTVRIPADITGKYRKVERATQQLSQEFFREPTAEEIAQHLPELELTPTRVQEIKNTAKNFVSLDRQVSYGNADTASYISAFKDLIEDKNAESPEEYAMEARLEDAMDALFAKILTPRECEIINLRFGRKGYEPHTHVEVGKKFCLSREWVRRLEAGALAKLSRPRNKKMLQKLISSQE